MKTLKGLLAKLPWDRKYLQIAFHVIFTLAVVYALVLLLNSAALGLGNLSSVIKAVAGAVGRVCNIFAPVIIAAVIAYALNPMADFFQTHTDNFFGKMTLKYPNRHRIAKKAEEDSGPERRVAGAALSYLSILLCLGLFAFLVIARAGGKVSGNWLDDTIEGIMVTMNGLEEFTANIEVKLLEWGAQDIFSSFISDIAEFFGNLLKQIAGSATRYLSNAGGGLMAGFLGAVIAFYLIMDKNIIKQKLHGVMELILPTWADTGLKRFFGKTHRILSGYINGVLAEACIVALMIGGWLAIIGVDFAFAIGIVSGIANIIPYVGATVAFLLAVLVALIGGEPMTAVLAAVGILVIQQIDGMFVQPRVVGVNVQMSPPLVLASLYVFGELFGLAGMVLAVPVCAVAKMLLEDYFEELSAEKSTRI